MIRNNDKPARLERILFEKIANRRSMTAIAMFIEEGINDPNLNRDAKDHLIQMQELNDLDRIAIIAYEYLGNTAEANKIRSFLARKATFNLRMLTPTTVVPTSVEEPLGYLVFWGMKLDQVSEHDSFFKSKQLAIQNAKTIRSKSAVKAVYTDKLVTVWPEAEVN